jgi:hypothetical protein
VYANADKPDFAITGRKAVIVLLIAPALESSIRIVFASPSSKPTQDQKPELVALSDS